MCMIVCFCVVCCCVHDVIMVNDKWSPNYVWVKLQEVNVQKQQQQIHFLYCSMPCYKTQAGAIRTLNLRKHKKSQRERKKSTEHTNTHIDQSVAREKYEINYGSHNAVFFSPFYSINILSVCFK